MSSVPPPSYDSYGSQVAASVRRPIGGLGRRIIAFILDAIVVGVAASLIALPLFSTFARLGPWGHLVGFCIALPYFAILESRIGGGRTLGKRLLRLQVVDAGGSAISFPKAVLRYTIFAIPYFMNGLALPSTRTSWTASTLINIAIFGLGGATFYLVCFNRRTRQGVHDLAAGAYVAEAEKTGAMHPQPIWRMNWVILGSALVVLFSVAGILENKAMTWGPFPQMLQDVSVIEGMSGVQQAGVQELTSWTGDTKRKIYVVNIRWSGKSADEESTADTVASLILRNDRNVQRYDLLRVVMIRGYDLGIAHAQIARSFEHSPASWNSRLFKAAAPESAAPTKI